MRGHRAVGVLQHHRGRPPDARPRSPFEVVNRKGIVVDEATEQVHIPPGSAPTGPELRETGSKETAVRTMPEQSGQPHERPLTGRCRPIQ